MATPSVGALATLVRFLYTHNPFYLVGTLLILVGLQQCLGSDPRIGTSGLLPALLAFYTLLLAGIAVLVIRYGQVWDDARTILLVIALLFFMLSASLDFHLAMSPLPGTVLLVAALAFVIAVSEGLQRLLRINLAPQYRGPFYLMLTLLFLFPAVPAWLMKLDREPLIPWAIFAFPALVGLVLLTLLPAARTKRRREPASNTPWKWPFYPWSLFVFLTVGAIIRAWWLTISFEPLRGPLSYFQPYFLLPICLAWSALILEIGRARRSRVAVATGMIMPLAALVASFAGFAQSDVEADFISRLAETIGSPPQIAATGLLAFYGYAWLRRVQVAEGFLLATGLIAALVGPETFSLSSLTPPQPVPLVCVAATLLALAVAKRSTWRAMVGTTMIASGASFATSNLLDPHTLEFWQWHAPLLSIIAMTTIFDDSLARQLRQIAWRALPCLAIAGAVVYPWALPVPSLVLASYLGLTLLLSISLWQRQKEMRPLLAVLVTLQANLLVHLATLYGLLERSVLAAGLPWMAGGVAVVLIALGISLLKMGMWQQARGYLAWLNEALGGQETARQA